MNDFLPTYVHFNGQTFISVFEQFSFTSKFFGLKMQNSSFCKKNGFYNIDVYVVTNWSVRLEKHQTIEILLMVDFLLIFKLLHFFKKKSRFYIFTSISW